MAADFGSGTSSYVDWREWSFANVDISLHLTRMPEGEWIRIAAETDGAGNGIAIVHARLADERGEIGQDRKSVVEGKSVSVRVDLGGRRIIKKKKKKTHDVNKKINII